MTRTDVLFIVAAVLLVTLWLAMGVYDEWRTCKPPRRPPGAGKYWHGFWR